ncbi:MFS general substrate transporter [Dendrothele bispora CBS 962.96]|uniref:MFS general substrate transporter n=1 Tax=Dendrothele bispora (strain CBS 962.96) TaxID=1314807 RepID=A0A4S8MM63_DENBC|nr:MFS general substrate transporter [Dendrothele bispora CBS 962.96]
MSVEEKGFDDAIRDHIEHLPDTKGEEFDKEFERKTIRYVDFRMLPLLGLVYSVSLIDRANLAIARTAGMEDDLQIEIGERYSMVSCFYFVPYVLLQLPSNLLLRRFGVRSCITSYILGWGAAQLGMAFVTDWKQLLACRVLLGAFEAGFFPAMTFIITTWYKRHEMQARLAIFYLSAICISGFTPILSYAISLLKGKRGLNGWAWIFLVEGAITLALGILVFLYIPDFPDRNTFLTPEQTRLVLERVQRDRGDALADKITTRKVFNHLGDWLIWAYSLMFMGGTMVSYAISFFNTTILRSMGYSVAASLLLTTPPYIAAVISAFIFSRMSDKTKHRAGFIALQTLITIVGLVLMGYGSQNGVRYFGIFLSYMGASGVIPGALAYSANNVVSHSKRSVSTALLIAWGGIGGILGTTVFRQQDFPRYINGIWATLGAQFLTLVLLVATTTTLRRRNRRFKEGKITEPLEGQPGFFYTL